MVSAKDTVNVLTFQLCFCWNEMPSWYLRQWDGWQNELWQDWEQRYRWLELKLVFCQLLLLLSVSLSGNLYILVLGDSCWNLENGNNTKFMFNWCFWAFDLNITCLASKFWHDSCIYTWEFWLPLIAAAVQRFWLQQRNIQDIESKFWGKKL